MIAEIGFVLGTLEVISEVLEAETVFVTVYVFKEGRWFPMEHCKRARLLYDQWLVSSCLEQL